jgi:hypothetical protein
LFLVTASAAVAQQTFITIASTTSKSGLFDYLLHDPSQRMALSSGL